MHNKIKSLCKEKGISINKLEKDLGFSTGYISKLNASSPSIDKVKKIAGYLGVEINDLI